MPTLPSTARGCLLLLLLSGLGSPMARAQVTAIITPAAAEMTAGQHMLFIAQRSDDAPAQWLWTLVEPGGGTLEVGATIDTQLIKYSDYWAPEVDTPATFHVHVQDAGDASVSAVATIQVRPRLVFEAEVPEVLCGSACGFTIREGKYGAALPQDSLFRRVEVREQDAGTVLRGPDHRFHFQAREGLEMPTEVHVVAEVAFTNEGVKLPKPYLLEATLKVLPKVKITQDKHNVVGEDTSKLQAALAIPWDGPAPVWDWAVVEPGGGSVTRDPDHPGQYLYRAPKVRGPRLIHLRATDRHSQATALAEFHLMPRIPGLSDHVLETVFPQSLGDGWMELVPAMTLFAGSRLPEVPPQDRVLADIKALAWIDDAAEMGNMNAHWLVADARGVRVMNARGELDPEPITGMKVSAIATRPPGSKAKCPREVVFGMNVRIEPDDPHSPTKATLWTLGPDRTIRPLVITYGQMGPSMASTIETISSLALAADGTLYVGDGDCGRIWKVAPDGRAEVLAGDGDPSKPSERDHRPRRGLLEGEGRLVKFRQLGLRSLSLDPGTGSLYVDDLDRICEIRPDGWVRTILGSRADAKGIWQSDPNPPFVIVPGLQVRDGRLYFFDRRKDTLEVFNLETRRLDILVGSYRGGALHQDHTQMGPLKPPTRYFPQAQCARLGGSLGVLGVNGHGMALVALPYGLARVDLFPGSGLAALPEVPARATPARLATPGQP